MNAGIRREKFAECAKMGDAIKIVQDAEVCHKSYSFYTLLGRVESMLKEDLPCLWLTRINSGVFDDLIENEKYGTDEEQGKLFIKCFTYGFRESAAMWGLYCPATYKAIRVSVTDSAIKSLLKSKCVEISSGKPKSNSIRAKIDVSDIVYASVKTKKDDPGRSTYLYWNGVRTKQIPSLFEDLHRKMTAGRLKDIEWLFEDEARLIAKVPDPKKSQHIAVKLPPEFIKGMSFTLSPWADEDEERMVRDKLARLLRAVGRNNVSSENEKVFKPSALKGALTKWAKQRGLD